jgi:hypothetical protein
VLVLYIGRLVCVYGPPVYMVEFWYSSTQKPIDLGLFSSSGTIIGAETLVVKKHHPRLIIVLMLRTQG